jgi:hypothetical protein
MSIAQASRPPQELHLEAPGRQGRWRFPALCALLLLAVGYTILLAQKAPPPDGPVIPFVPLWMLGFAPYLAACLIVLATPAPTGRRQWSELGLILVGACVLRTLLLPIPPDLSHDSWRYLWDARVTLHGYSPYVYSPNDSHLMYLRDFIYDNSRFRNVPTIYPPGAQAIYLLSYLIAPSNLFVLKAIFLLLDIVTCVALALLLKRRGLDPSRCILYAWCPLPIVEFAIQGHLDASTLAFMTLAVLTSLSQWRGARVLTGFLIGMAALTKIYPIVLLLALMRRRDRALLATCIATIIAAYIPYIILGHGQILGFFGTYASEHAHNAGIVPLVMDQISAYARFNTRTTLILTYLADLTVVGATALAVLIQRIRQRISPEAATLLLLAAIFAVSTHIFPWYTTALLPWAAVLLGPLWTRGDGINARGLAAALAWYFAFISISSYVFDSLHHWDIYYILAYYVPLAGLALAAIVGVRATRGSLKDLLRDISTQMNIRKEC